MAIFVPRFVRQLRDVLLTSPADGEVLTYDSADGKWKNETGGGGGGPPTGSAGGVLGGTYPNPSFAVDMATQAELDAHVTDLVDAHDASAISFAPTGTIAATDVQTAIAEAASEATTDLSGAVILAPASSARNVIQPTAGAVIAAIVKAHASQSVDLEQWQKSDGTVLFRVTRDAGLSSRARLAFASGWQLYDDATSVGLRLSFQNMIDTAGFQTNEFALMDFVNNAGNGFIIYYDASGESYSRSLMLLTDGNGTAPTTGAKFSIFGGDGLGNFGAGQGASISSVAALWAKLKAWGWLDSGSTAPSIPLTSEVVLKSLYDANTVLAANSDDTPAAVTMGASTILARLAAGNIKAASVAEIITLLQAYTVGGTDVAVADGGTGASTAADARTNLGLVIGTDVEAHDTDLTTIAGLSPSNDDVLQRKAGAWANRTIAQLLTDLAAPGTTFQPLDSDLTAIAALADPNADRILFWDDSAGAYTFLTPGTGLTITGTTIDASGGSSPSVAYLSEQQTQNTQSGTFTSGAWRTRVLNTEDDPSGIVTLSSNQFTLGAGTYLITARAPVFAVDRHQTRIQNITDSTTALIGSSEFAQAGPLATTPSVVSGRIVIAGTKTFELQHQCQTTAGSRGLGVEANFTTEVYAQIKIEKIA